MENTNKRKYTMFNIMTDRWLKTRLQSPWRSTKTMGEKKRPQPNTNHGQMLLVCSVREWRQTGLAPQHTARTRTHAPGNNITRTARRLAREGTHNTDASRSQCCHNRRLRTRIERTATTIPGIDARPMDGQTDRLWLLLFWMFCKLLFRTGHAVRLIYTLLYRHHHINHNRS